MRSVCDGAGSGVQWNSQTLTSSPLTTPKRSAAPSRWLMRGLDWVWPGSSLGGATPLNRGWSVGTVCRHTPSTLHTTFCLMHPTATTLPLGTVTLCESRRVQAVWWKRLALRSCARYTLYICMYCFSFLYETGHIFSALFHFCVYGCLYVRGLKQKPSSSINYRCGTYSLCLRFTLSSMCVCVSVVKRQCLETLNQPCLNKHLQWNNLCLMMLSINRETMLTNNQHNQLAVTKRKKERKKMTSSK